MHGRYERYLTFFGMSTITSAVQSRSQASPPGLNYKQLLHHVRHLAANVAAALPALTKSDRRCYLRSVRSFVQPFSQDTIIVRCINSETDNKLLYAIIS